MSGTPYTLRDVLGRGTLDKPFPAYQGDEPYVFVCYAHDDEDMVYPEIGWLHEQGIRRRDLSRKELARCYR